MKERTTKRWRDTLRQVLSIAIAASIALAARSTLADHYVVPSGSMEPTVQVGDRIVVDKLAYGIRVPFSQTYITTPRDPQPGDVVVLVSPESGVILLKRVIAGPGDTVEVIDGQLVINGQPLPITSDDGSLVEELGGRRHLISLHRGGGPDYGPVTIPASRFLVLGDNRGDSRDGRSFGLVERRAILGRALACYFGSDHFQWRQL